MAAADGNGSGLTQRELLMELRDDVKDIKQTLTEKADAQHMWTMEDRITRLESEALRREGPVVKQLRELTLDVRDLKILRQTDLELREKEKKENDGRWQRRSYLAPWVSISLALCVFALAIWVATH